MPQFMSGYLGTKDDTGSRGVFRSDAKTKTCAVLSACYVVFEGVTSDYINGHYLVG